MAAVVLVAFGLNGAVGSVEALAVQAEAGSSNKSVVGGTAWSLGVSPPALFEPLAMVALAGVVAFMLVRAWRGTDWIGSAGWAALATLVLVLSSKQWYIAWLLPLAAVAESSRLRKATVALGALLLLVAPLAPSVSLSPLRAALEAFGLARAA